ncbi:Mitochondrial enolase superfamily member 1 [Sarcoptes scabiei]|uniref:Mitochondrial enolase superfamily member 1 n=1 Tax=Sarcoptes scabiei TaxID=52283 RepID=A0A834R227_SARSC|nr:Mitochondrial enolase superfamily member 1 [Sarcoptes scabiei]
MAKFLWKLTNDGQLRWIGPEKGAIHLASAAILNAVWDFWAKLEQKPLWKLLIDLEPEHLIECLDLAICQSDVLSKQEALNMLKMNQKFTHQRGMWKPFLIIKKNFISFYFERVGSDVDRNPFIYSSCGWTNYDENHRREMCRQAIDDGFRRFKVKVGTGIETDRKRLQVVREEIGPDCLLMVDANQRWEVQEAIDDMKQLVDFGILWIEEPTTTELRPSGIKWLLESNARILISNTNMSACGGVGLCEYVQHLAIWDFIAVSGPNPNRMIEYNSHLTEHFLKPARCWNGSYQVPKESGIVVNSNRNQSKNSVFQTDLIGENIENEKRKE